MFDLSFLLLGVSDGHIFFDFSNYCPYSNATFLFHCSFVKCQYFLQPYLSSLFEDADVPELWFVNEIQDGMKEGRQTELVTVCDSTCP